MTASHSTVRSTLADLSASEGVQFYREGWYTPDHSGKLWYLVRQGVDGEWTAFCYHGPDPRPELQRLLDLPFTQTRYLR